MGFPHSPFYGRVILAAAYIVDILPSRPAFNLININEEIPLVRLYALVSYLSLRKGRSIEGCLRSLAIIVSIEALCSLIKRGITCLRLHDQSHVPLASSVFSFFSCENMKQFKMRYSPFLSDSDDSPSSTFTRLNCTCVTLGSHDVCRKPCSGSDKSGKKSACFTPASFSYSPPSSGCCDPLSSSSRARDPEELERKRA